LARGYEWLLLIAKSQRAYAPEKRRILHQKERIAHRLAY